MKLETIYSIHDKVKIIELSCKGRINAIFIDSGGVTYQVRYFDKGDAKNVYFFQDELELL